MKFKGMLLMAVIMFSMISPKETKAVGEVGQAVCGSVSAIMSLVPDSVGYLDGWKLKCKLTKGCWFEYKCRSLAVADEMEKGLTLVCNAITSYGPGFFPGSSLTNINADLADIQSELLGISSILDPMATNKFDPLAADAALSNISNSLSSIESLMPSIPGESSKWVKSKSDCDRAEGGAADTASSTPVNMTAPTTTAVQDANDAAEAEQDAQLNSEILTACSTQPDYVPEYYNPALASYTTDHDAWQVCFDACGAFDFACQGACGVEPDWVTGYENPAQASYNSDLQAWYDCREVVQENFNYVPSQATLDLQDAAADAVGVDNSVATNATDLINQSTNSGVCIPQVQIDMMPPEAAANIDPALICPP